MSSPSNTMRPAVGSSMRRMARPVVDLPQPDFADQPQRVAARQREADAVDSLDGADLALDQHTLAQGEVHLEAFDAQQLFAGGGAGTAHGRHGAVKGGCH